MAPVGIFSVFTLILGQVIVISVSVRERSPHQTLGACSLLPSHRLLLSSLRYTVYFWSSGSVDGVIFHKGLTARRRRHE